MNGVARRTKLAQVESKPASSGGTIAGLYMTDTISKSFNWGRVVPLAVIGLGAIIGAIFFRDYLSFSALSDNRETLIAWRDGNYLVAAISYIAIYAAVVAFSLPGALIMTLTGGFLFGLFPGVLFVVTAATIGACAIFMAAKFGFGDALQDRLSSSDGMITRIRDGIQDNEIPFLFLMRLVPAVPFFAANLIPALAGVGLRNFAFTTFFGIMPGSAVYTWVGAGLGEVFDRGETPSLGIIWEWHILGPILALCALATLPIVVKYMRKGAV